MKSIYTFYLLSFILFTSGVSQWGTPFNQRDDEYRLLGLKRAKSAYEAAKAELERNESLFNDELISENSLEDARREFADAEVNYQQSLLAVIFEKQYVTVESAVKYQSEDGRKHVRLKLANASGGGQEYRKLINIDDALFRSLQPDVVNNVYVSLLNGENAIISQPYEAKIDRLLIGQPVTLDFALLQDLDAVVVTPDLGYAKRGRNYAADLELPLAFVEKRRVGNENKREAMNLIGEVAGKDVIIVDDLVDTAGSIQQAVNLVKERGARDVYVGFTHPVLSDPAVERLRSLPIKEIVTTDTLPIPPEKRLPNMKVLTVAGLLAEVIMRTHEGRSVGELFNE